MKKIFVTAVLSLLLSTSFLTPACGQNNLKGYEWLEGKWIGVYPYGEEYALINITKDYYQIVNKRWADEDDESKSLYEQEKHPIKIEMTTSHVVDDLSGPCIDNTIWIGKTAISLVMGEYEPPMVLERIDTETAEGEKMKWLYGVWSSESFDRLTMESYETRIVITPKYYKVGERGDMEEYVIKKDKDSDGKVWYCLVNKKYLADNQGSWKEISGLCYPEGEECVYISSGAWGWDECEKIKVYSF